MNKTVRTFGYMLMVSLLPVLFGSCKKETSSVTDQRNTFIRVYDKGKDVLNWHIEETANNGVFMAGFKNVDYVNGDFELHLEQTNEFGQSLWQKTFYPTRPMQPNVIRLNNGNRMITSTYSQEVFIINDEGNAINHTLFRPSFNYFGNYFSAPVIGDDGKVYVSYTNGSATVWPSNNYISKIDDLGNGESLYQFTDALFKHKILKFDVYKVENNYAWVSGMLFLKEDWGWTDIRKSFYARIPLKPGLPDVLILNDNDTSEHEIIIDIAKLEEGGSVSVVASSQHEVGYNEANLRNQFSVYKIDDDLNEVWRKVIKLNALSMQPSRLTLCTDGGFLVTGFCITSGSSMLRPFVIKLNSTGVVEFQEIYYLEGEAEFYGGLLAKNGSYYFTGYATGFGRGKSNLMPILVRTDQNGLLEK